ncbi:MAG: O-antigen ligase family protein, partial [Caulobacteraceae bacterium]
AEDQPPGPDRFVLWTGAFLAIALMAGGASASPISAGIVRVAAAPVLAFGVRRLMRDGWPPGALWPLILAALAAVVVAAQLIPMPPSLWTALPGRDLYVRTYAAAGLPLPWLPVDLTPALGWNALLGLVPPAAMLAALPTLDAADRRRLAFLVLAIGVAGAVLGMVQLRGGEASPLRLWSITNRNSAVGFFANRNHHAIFLAATLPLAGYLAMRRAGHGGGRTAFWLSAAAAYTLVVAVGAAASGSRAGLVLGVLGAVGALVVAARARVRRPGPAWRLAALAWPALLALCVAGVAALSIDPRLAREAQAQLGGDLRFSLTPTTFAAGARFAPLGAGAGAFADIYPMVEPLADMGPAFINHAHDDLAEVWLEAGVPGVLLLAALVAWWVLASWAAMSERRRVGAALALAGSMTTGLLLVHSLVDYPLRTPALATLFAFAIGLVTRAPTDHNSDRGRGIMRLGAFRPIR